ncbi:hypothetical protein CRUP_028049 [Coryphaenoides rupestris]|nr:hypothetical protein CRUP_028049 [Coryphaenoides rupestris]
MHQPSAPPDEKGHFLFQWNDDNCNSKNNYVCKYALAVVLGRTRRAAATGVPAARRGGVPAQADPEVPLAHPQVLDEALNQPLLALRLDAEQLAAAGPAGAAGVLIGQPPPAVLDVGDLVAGPLCPPPADSVACG